MSDLTNKEQRAVRLALRFLRFRVGAWKPLGKALGYSEEGVRKAGSGQNAVTPTLALRVARFAGVGMDDVLSGQWLSGRVCPHCGHPPDDAADEDTVTTDVIVTDAPRVAPFAASAGWKK
jgi:hypothetical protein